MPHAITFGTTGWSYDDWVGNFYPGGTAKGDYLAHYAQHYPAVEVDSTFYAIPREQTVRRWAEVTPDNFRFSLKVPREITHERRLDDADDVMEKFLDAIAPLGDKLLCVHLQFGYFNRQKFASAGPFFERLDAFCDKFAGQAPLACEIRNKQWLNGPYFDLLRRHGVTAALVEQAWLPPIDRVVAQHDVLTGEFAYVRLIGDHKGIEAVTQTWDRVVLDRGDDLDRVAGVVRELAEKTPVYTFVNNHYAGHGPSTADDLAGRVQP